MQWTRAYLLQKKNLPESLPCNLRILEKISGKYVLCAARVEPLKNQLRILKALKNVPDIPLVFAGSTKGDKRYNRKVRSYAKKRGNTYFINEVSQEYMAFVYSNALVHVLPSFQESSGLATIEALFCGIPVVTSSDFFCPVRFYKFDKFGIQCNPYSTRSIRKSILFAKEQTIDGINKGYKSYFSYKNAALLTYKAYSSIQKSTVQETNVC